MKEFLLKILTDGCSAFAGALFAFLFFLLAEKIRSKQERLEKHRYALGKLEYYLNDCIAILHKNLCQAADAQKHMQQLEAQESNEIIFDRLSVLPVNKEILIDILSSSFPGKMYSYQRRAEVLNNDIKGISNQYDSFACAYLNGGNIDKRSHQANRQNYLNQILEIAKYCDLHLDKAITLLAEVRVRLLIHKKKHWYMPHLSRKHMQKQEAEVSKKIPHEVETLKKEMQETLTESLAEIDKIESASPTGKRKVPFTGSGKP